MNIIIPIYFIFGLIVWRFKKEYLPIYCIYITTFGLVPLEILSPSIDGEGISLSFDACVKISAILLLLCMVINVVSRKDKKIFFNTTFKYWISIFVAGVYFLIWQTLHDRNSGGGVTLSFLYVSLLPIYFRSISTPLCLKGYKTHFIIIFIIEMLCVIYTYTITPIYLYQLLGNEQYLISGTFKRFNVLASFLGMSGIIISYAYFYKQLKGWYYACFIILISFFILSTGARMQFIWMCLTILLIAFSNFNDNKGICVSFLTGGVLLFLFMQSINLRGYTSRDAESGIERQFYGIVSALNKSSVENGEQTQDISTYILNRHFFKSPLIGNGKGDKDYAYHPTVKTLSADAAFAFILVEYGLLGFIFFLLIIYNAFKIERIGMSVLTVRKAKILFFSLFIITITETGLFDFTLMLYVWIYMEWLKYTQNSIIIKE